MVRHSQQASSESAHLILQYGERLEGSQSQPKCAQVFILMRFSISLARNLQHDPTLGSVMIFMLPKTWEHQHLTVTSFYTAEYPKSIIDLPLIIDIIPGYQAATFPRNFALQPYPGIRVFRCFHVTIIYFETCLFLLYSDSIFITSVHFYYIAIIIFIIVIQ